MGGEHSQQQQRPASVEGVIKQQKTSSSSEEPSSAKPGSSGSPSKQHNSSGGGQHQRDRFYSTPAQSMRGTHPLSHTPSTLPKVSMSMASPQFTVPRINYSPLHHTGPHGGMYAGFPSYQPYNTTSPGMPTQASYPPTFNPYSGSTGSSYMGPSGVPGSSLYNTNSLIQTQSYSTHSNMFNYMPYSDNKQQHGSPALMTYTPQHAYPYSSVATGGTGVVPGSSTSAAIGNYSSLPAIASTNQELTRIVHPNIATTSSISLHPQTLSSVTTSMGSIDSCNQEIMPSNDRTHSGSPQEVGSPLDRVVGCDSTTTGVEASAELGELDNHAGSEDGNVVMELQHYTTRYVSPSLYFRYVMKPDASSANTASASSFAMDTQFQSLNAYHHQDMNMLSSYLEEGKKVI